MKHVSRILLFITVIIVFLGKLHIALARYFDPDEFSQLQWAYNIFKGQLPYKDFFYFYPPLFQWMLAPWFLLPEGAYLMFVFRLLTLIFTISITWLLYNITNRIIKNKTLSLFAPLTYMVFPIIFDKTIEIRPDTPMLLFFLASIWLISKKIPQYFLSGLCFGLSLLFLPKIAFAIIPLVYLAWSARKKIADVYVFLFGSAIIGMALLSYFLASGTLSYAYEAIIRGSIIINFGITHYSAIDALKPWPIVYLASGGGFPWIISSSLWICGLIGAILLLGKNKRIGIFFILFIVFGILFLFISPYTMIQYFMPLAAIASIGTAVLLFSVIATCTQRFPWHKNDIQISILLFIPLILFLSFFLQYRERINTTGWDEQMRVLDIVHTVIPSNEPVYDMVGSFMYRTTPFPYMFSEYASFIDHYNPFHVTLQKSLIDTQTKYLILDQKGYLFWKPKQQDLNFILNTYVMSSWFKVYVPGVTFSCTLETCTQYNLKNEPIATTTTVSLPIRGSYELLAEPNDQIITINGIPMKNGDIRNLSEGLYTFTASPFLRSFMIRWYNL